MSNETVKGGGRCKSVLSEKLWCWVSIDWPGMKEEYTRENGSEKEEVIRVTHGNPMV